MCCVLCCASISFLQCNGCEDLNASDVDRTGLAAAAAVLCQQDCIAQHDKQVLTGLQKPVLPALLNDSHKTNEHMRQRAVISGILHDTSKLVDVKRSIATSRVAMAAGISAVLGHNSVA